LSNTQLYTKLYKDSREYKQTQRGSRKNIMLDTATTKPQQKVAYSVKEVAQQTTLSVPYIRNEIRDGNLKIKRAGRRVLVLDSDLKEYLENLSEEKK
jgi:excisionase family DNA binding protein